jgi:hypothetical protein
MASLEKYINHSFLVATGKDKNDSPFCGQILLENSSRNLILAHESK